VTFVRSYTMTVRANQVALFDFYFYPRPRDSLSSFRNAERFDFTRSVIEVHTDRVEGLAAVAARFAFLEGSNEIAKFYSARFGLRDIFRFVFSVVAEFCFLSPRIRGVCVGHTHEL
jgi:hypothetical protein